MGVGDVSEVHVGAGSSRHSSGCNDGGRSRRKSYSKRVGRHCNSKHGAQEQHSRDRIHIGDGAWCEHGACIIHRADSKGANRI